MKDVEMNGKFTITQNSHFIQILNRVLQKKKKIAGYLIPAGWIVMVYPSTVHSDSSKYDDPLSFNPFQWQVRFNHFQIIISKNSLQRRFYSRDFLSTIDTCNSLAGKPFCLVFELKHCLTRLSNSCFLIKQ